MTRICKTCRREFDGEAWMSQCLECYRSFKGMPRIVTANKAEGRGFVVLAHPSVTQAEITAWVNAHYGACPTPSYWEPVKVKPNMEAWFVCTNDD